MEQATVEVSEVADEVLLRPILAERSYVTLGLYRSEGERLGLVAEVGLVPLPREVSHGEGMAGRAAATGLLQEGLVADFADAAPAGSTVARREMALPVHFEGQLVGVVVAAVSAAETWASDDRVRLERLAALAAPVLLDAHPERAWRSLEAMDALRQAFPFIDWAGTYRLDPASPQELILGCQLGPPTPHVRIPVAKGICGAAIRENATLNVPDVQADGRFIACSITTRSELVVPIRTPAGATVAEIDLDSDTPNAFTPALTIWVESLAASLGERWDT